MSDSNTFYPGMYDFEYVNPHPFEADWFAENEGECDYYGVKMTAWRVYGNEDEGRDWLYLVDSDGMVCHEALDYHEEY